MTRKILERVTAMAVALGLMASASANSIGFSQSAYFAGSGGEVTILYDFSAYPMFSGGFNLVYDTNHLEFVSYTQAELAPDAQAVASPIGSLTSPGLYSGAGIGSFDLLSGMSGSGVIGTFVFNVNFGGSSDETPCGMSLCLVPSITQPFASFAGADVTDDIFANGITAAGFVVDPLPMPIPAAVWLMLGGLGALFGVGRKG